MRVTVKIFPGLKRHISQKAKDRFAGNIWEIPSDTTLQDIVDILEIPSIVIVAIAVNSVLNRDMSTVLKEGDEITFQPMLTGG